MAEVIAKRSDELYDIYRKCTIISAGVFLLSFIAAIVLIFAVRVNDIGAPISGCAIFAFVFVICLGLLLSFKRTPVILIKYEGGQLQFADGLFCSPGELQRVTYSCKNERGIKFFGER